MSSVSTQDTGTQVAPIQEDSVPQVASSTRREGILDAIALVAALAIFLSLTLYQLDLPGLYPDEAFDVVPTMQIVLGHPVELQRNAADMQVPVTLILWLTGNSEIYLKGQPKKPCRRADLISEGAIQAWAISSPPMISVGLISIPMTLATGNGLSRERAVLRPI